MRSLTVLSALLLSCTAAAAQTAPPIHGVTGTVVTDSTIRSEEGAAHAIAEGAARVVDGAKKVLPGGKGTKQNPLDGFTDGRRVTLRETAAEAGREAPATTEGVVIDVNRRRNQITIRLSDRKTETLRLATPDAAADVVVSYTDNTGAKVDRDFKRIS